MSDDESITYFLEIFLCIRNQLIRARVAYSNDELTFQLLYALPKPYKGFVISMGRQPNLTFDQLCHALRKEEVVIGVHFSKSTTTFYRNYKRNFTKNS
jgi:hypothetical protein